MNHLGTIDIFSKLYMEMARTSSILKCTAHVKDSHMSDTISFAAGLLRNKIPQEPLQLIHLVLPYPGHMQFHELHLL